MSHSNPFIKQEENASSRRISSFSQNTGGTTATTSGSGSGSGNSSNTSNINTPFQSSPASSIRSTQSFSSSLSSPASLSSSSLFQSPELSSHSQMEQIQLNQIESIARLLIEAQTLQEQLTRNLQREENEIKSQSQSQSQSQPPRPQTTNSQMFQNFSNNNNINTFNNNISSYTSQSTGNLMHHNQHRRSSLPNTGTQSSISSYSRSQPLYQQQLAPQIPSMTTTRSLPLQSSITSTSLTSSMPPLCKLLQQLLIPPPWASTIDWPNSLLRSPAMRDLLTRLWHGGAEYESRINEWGPFFLTSAFQEISRQTTNNNENIEACLFGADVVRKKYLSSQQSFSSTTSSLPPLHELSPTNNPGGNNNNPNDDNNNSLTGNSFPTFSSPSSSPPPSSSSASSPLSLSLSSSLPSTFLSSLSSIPPSVFSSLMPAPNIGRTFSSPPLNFSRLYEKKKQKRRRSEELAEKEKWHCSNNGCGRYYRRSSTSSIRAHKDNCPFALHNINNVKSEIRGDDNDDESSTSESTTENNYLTMPPLIPETLPTFSSSESISSLATTTSTSSSTSSSSSLSTFSSSSPFTFPEFRF